MIGEVVGGRYALEERLGSGGSSSVWRARDEVADRPVAVKLLHLDAAESPEALARFDREARILKGVVSPNTVELLDRGESDGRPFLVFELIEGTDLARAAAAGGHDRDRRRDRDRDAGGERPRRGARAAAASTAT